ncbi:hypothetical protein vBEfaSHEf13_033 [Enterococcus phage vB_EfaS_HEf13]|nr:hypothetical protein vBEfaSHEf13_033 [Enterococcus phage vB_EfaS_HEf13]
MNLTTEEYIITSNKSNSKIFKDVPVGSKFTVAFNLNTYWPYGQPKEEVEVWIEVAFTRAVIAHKTTLANVRKVLKSNSLQYELANK